MHSLQHDLHVFPGQAAGLSPESMNTGLSVMVGLLPTIQAFASLIGHGVQDVDARHKGEHDELEDGRVHGFRALRCAKPRNDSAFPSP
jgi:hypothetical protein